MLTLRPTIHPELRSAFCPAFFLGVFGVLAVEHLLFLANNQKLTANRLSAADCSWQQRQPPPQQRGKLLPSAAISAATAATISLFSSGGFSRNGA